MLTLTGHVSGLVQGPFTRDHWIDHIDGDFLEWAIGFREDVLGEFRWSGDVNCGVLRVLGPEGTELAHYSWETAPLPTGYVRVPETGDLDAKLVDLLGGER
ncbi:hypothetical protein GCM10023147_51290 [Tsukamurella soli]|uniref:Activator of Hsp90 ATPase homolog 1-like protein n=1 Tax=Tsukamurella soli TaxID=644556 RepID=A0ABP8KHH9_9ACTN